MTLHSIVPMAAGLILAASALAFPETASTNPVKTGYAPVNGLELYYEIHGTGAPLILLHGGVGTIEMFGPNLSLLCKTRQVIAVHLQAHGHTADIDRPLRYEFMADDIAALMKYLGIAQADVLGYSLGGGVALQTIIRYPHLVRKVVLVSAVCRRDGWYPEVLAGMENLGPAAAEGMKHSPLYSLYPNVDWAGLFTKLGDLLRQDYDWSQDVAAIKAPAMIVFADADSMRLTHILEFFRLLGGGGGDGGLDGSGRPNSRLAILPGVTHYNILSSPTVAELVTPFLDAPMPEIK